jgi:hypothetical protein
MIGVFDPPSAGTMSKPIRGQRTDAALRPLPLASAFVGTFFLVGIPYWTIPIQQLSLPDDLSMASLATSAVFAAIACTIGRQPAWAAGLAIAAGVLAVVMARVLVDVLGDSSSHNLWPFEIVLALGYALPAGCAGAGLCWLAKRIRGG